MSNICRRYKLDRLQIVRGCFKTSLKELSSKSMNGLIVTLALAFTDKTRDMERVRSFALNTFKHVESGERPMVRMTQVLILIVMSTNSDSYTSCSSSDSSSNNNSRESRSGRRGDEVCGIRGNVQSHRSGSWRHVTDQIGMFCFSGNIT